MVDTHGQFVWYELLTNDVEAAKAFYTSVVGWGIEDVSMPGMIYILLTVAGVSVAGLSGLPEEATQMGLPPRWIGYVGVEDVDAATARLEQLGGQVHVPPQNIGDISRFAVVADPQMARLALLQWLKPRREIAVAPRAAGRVGWHELFAVDCEKAFAFYSALFRWQKGIASVGAMGTYQLFSAAGKTSGGILTKPPTIPEPAWLHYFNVGDVDAAIDRVKAGGGQVLSGPIEAPDGSWVVQCTDPQGALFALIGKRSPRAVGFLERVAALD
jgi:uncharacterized protein